MANSLTKTNANIRDYLLDVNDLNQPKVLDLSEIETGKMNSAELLIVRLLLRKKGTYPDYPDLDTDLILKKSLLL